MIMRYIIFVMYIFNGLLWKQLAEVQNAEKYQLSKNEFIVLFKNVDGF